ncbi:hypothetical protein NLU13_1222 [Sarocladium strictum]|uniref:ENTH domain-containing protein n=1 Tax=Sarocladium strictum TaxID=5046 RepID=A0AA39GS32_SARSR|nr:hypothetical protein NLU13_1222 [Sarocladium strictum]
MLPSAIFAAERIDAQRAQGRYHNPPRGRRESAVSSTSTSAPAAAPPDLIIRDPRQPALNLVYGLPATSPSKSRSHSFNMSSSFEKSVKGATKIKNAPPKTKYIEHILVATHSGEAGIAEVFRALQYRLRDSTWTVVFKGLITVHLMIREGSPDVTLQFLARHRNMLAISSFTDAQTQGRNIRHYANYLAERARSYRDTNTDWVRAHEMRLEKITVDKGLLRETESVQNQLTALLKCDVLDTEPENEITIFVFRLLVLDLLALFQVLNQGLINILGHFFEMSKPDAERAMAIYRNFAKQTDFVVAYLSVARQHEHHTRVEVPKLKHAPVNLGRQLEEYLKDPDFEIHRRQYIAEQDAKRKGGFANRSKSKSPRPPIDNKPKTDADFPEPASNNPFPRTTNGASSGTGANAPQTNKGPDPDLIDFFDSIEQNQTPMQMQPPQQQQQQQQLGMQPQFQTSNPFPTQATGMQGFQQQPQQQPNGGFMQTQQTGFASNSPFQQQPQNNMFIQQQQMPQQQQQQQPLQPNFTGAGFGGYTPQPSFQPGTLGSIPQDSVPAFQNTGTLSPPAQQQLPFQPMQTGQQSTNPFRQSMLMTQQTGMMQPQQTGMPSSTMSSPVGGIQPLQRQSTNPFARSANSSPFGTTTTGQPSPFQSAAPIQAQPTGTNPFARASTMPTEQRPQTAGPMAPQPTGTNPFRQGAFVNHATGMGWQHGQAPIGGGLDQLGTTPVFPRPAQQTPWQQQ